MNDRGENKYSRYIVSCVIERVERMTALLEEPPNDGLSLARTLGSLRYNVEQLRRLLKMTPAEWE